MAPNIFFYEQVYIRENTDLFSLANARFIHTSFISRKFFYLFLVDLIINFDTRLVLQQLTSFKVFKNILWHTSCSYCRRTTWQDADTLQDHPSAPTTTVGAGSIRWCRCQKSSAAKISYPWRIYFTLWGGDAMRQGGMEKAGALQDFSGAGGGGQFRTVCRLFQLHCVSWERIHTRTLSLFFANERTSALLCATSCCTPSYQHNGILDT